MIRKVSASIVALLLALLGLSVLAAPAQATVEQEQQSFVVITWQMPSWSGERTPTWPQSIVSHNQVSTPEEGRWPATPECGYYQQDIYKYTNESDVAKVDALINGGVLNGPNNPAEPLISGGWGVAYQLVNNGPLAKCNQPEPEVTVDYEQRMSCDAGVEERATTTTTPYVWVEEEWQLGEPVVEVGEWTFVRDLNKAERAEYECDVVVEPPCEEDQPCWDCETDGNGDCGKPDKPEKPQPPKDNSPPKADKPAPELPHTGAGTTALLALIGSMLIGMGGLLVRKFS